MVASMNVSYVLADNSFSLRKIALCSFISNKKLLHLTANMVHLACDCNAASFNLEACDRLKFQNDSGDGSLNM